MWLLALLVGAALTGGLLGGSKNTAGKKAKNNVVSALSTGQRPEGAQDKGLSASDYFNDNPQMWINQFISPGVGLLPLLDNNTALYNDDLLRQAQGLGLSDREWDALIDQYMPEKFNLFSNPGALFESSMPDMDKFYKDLADVLPIYQEMMASVPKDLDLAQIYRDADAEIDAENQGILDLYDKMYSQELDTSNDMYNDAVNQILYNDAMNQSAIRQSARAEMNRQQRNAIIRGASAATRLVANINAQLGTQAQAAQQSLETSNNLAKMLINQRDAAMKTRREYANSQADLMRGSAERKATYRKAKWSEAESLQENDRQRWYKKYAPQLSGNPIGDVLLGRATSKAGTSSYDYKSGDTASY